MFELKEKKVLKDINNNEMCFVFDKEKIKPKKITSRAFPELLGLNKYNSIGKAILDRWGLLVKEDIDEMYIKRGELAETFANNYLKEKYAKITGKELITKQFNTKEENYDMFKKNENFGGVVDIGISEPEEQRAVVEVKSKNIKDYTKIIENGEIPQHETLQGEFLAFLSKTKKYIMAYVFFTNEQEEEIREKGVNVSFSYKDVIIKTKTFIVDEETTKERMIKVLKIYKNACEDGKISLSLFDDNEVIYLKTLLKTEEPRRIPIITDDDLPF